jgi:hypothetical protein
MFDHSSFSFFAPDVDLVVHAAGPFQRENECTVLQAAIATKVRNVQRLIIKCISLITR